MQILSKPGQAEVDIQMVVEEEEEGQVLVARERCRATGECLVGNYGCQDGWLSEQCP